MAIQSKDRSLLDYGRRQIFGVLFLFLLLVLSTTSYLILKPILEISSRTIALQMLTQLKLHDSIGSSYSSSQPPLSLNQLEHYQVSLAKTESAYSFLPFNHYVLRELEQETGKKLSYVEISTRPNFYWFRIDGETMSIGFARALIGTRPELAIFLLIVLIGGLSFILSTMIARHLNRPLALVETMTNSLAKGDFDARLPDYPLLEIDKMFSQLNKLSTDLKELLEQRVIFLAGISHDIRTPITRLKLLLALHESELDADYKEKSNRALDEIEALVRIYLDAGQFLVDEKVEEICLSSLLYDVLSGFDESFADLIEINDELKAKCSANSEALKRVLINLLSNIEKYAKPSKVGEVVIELSLIEKEKRQLAIRISDSGKGIGSEHLDEIYKPYYRLNETSSNPVSSGLGLSICRQICLSQGWNLTITNRNQGKSGLICAIKLPID